MELNEQRREVVTALRKAVGVLEDYLTAAKALGSFEKDVTALANVMENYRTALDSQIV
jgi:hypothetical protein